jgi:hypothetical protein
MEQQNPDILADETHQSMIVVNFCLYTSFSINDVIKLRMKYQGS